MFYVQSTRRVVALRRQVALRYAAGRLDVSLVFQDGEMVRDGASETAVLFTTLPLFFRADLEICEEPEAFRNSYWIFDFSLLLPNFICDALFL